MTCLTCCAVMVLDQPRSGCLGLVSITVRGGFMKKKLLAKLIAVEVDSHKSRIWLGVYSWAI